MSNTTKRDINNNLIETLNMATIYVIICGGIFILVAGNVGCMGNIIVFHSRAYRRQACFIYLFWETIASFFILNCILLTRILESGFNISLMDAFDSICKIREFISLFMYQNENTLFLFATLDRILAAQRSNRLRQWSNRVPLTYKVILVNALFWILVCGHRLIFYTNSTGTCWSQGGAYMAFDTYLDVSLSGVGSPLVVIVLAFILWKNIQSVIKQNAIRNAAAPGTLGTNQSHNQQVELQMAIMFWLQSILAIINYVPFAVYILYYMFTSAWNKSPLRVAWERLIIAFIRLSSYLFAAGTFYISIISYSGFREQFKNSFKIRRALHPTPVGNTGNQLVTHNTTVKTTQHASK